MKTIEKIVAQMKDAAIDARHTAATLSAMSGGFSQIYQPDIARELAIASRNVSGLGEALLEAARCIEDAQ